MAFCIPEEEYDENLHVIVSGPHENCTDCEPIPRGAGGRYFEISATNSTSLLPLPSDKIFLKVDDEVAKSLNRTSGQGFVGMSVMHGSVHYNPFWNFYLNPSSVRFVSMSEMEAAQSAMIDLNPSTIDEMVLDGSMPQGTEIFFSFDGKFREMEVAGIVMCQDPLLWTSEPISERGVYVQMGRCDGECSERLSNAGIEYCVDAILGDAASYATNLIQPIIDSNNEKIGNPSYQIDRQSYIQEIYKRLLDFDEISILQASESEQQIAISFNRYEGDLDLETNDE